jgi:hypothetical protein
MEADALECIFEATTHRNGPALSPFGYRYGKEFIDQRRQSRSVHSKLCRKSVARTSR